MGKAILIYDDSILGFATVYLKEQEAAGNINRSYITSRELDVLRERIVGMVEENSSPNDVIVPRFEGKEFYTPRELRNNKPEPLFIYDKNEKIYYTEAPIDYLKATYRDGINNPEGFRYYTNERLLSSVFQEENVK